jgi:hypothetical protein
MGNLVNKLPHPIPSMEALAKVAAAETQKRQAKYPALIAAGRLDQKRAEHEIGCMASIAALLKASAAAGRDGIVSPYDLWEAARILGMH